MVVVVGMEKVSNYTAEGWNLHTQEEGGLEGWGFERIKRELLKETEASGAEKPWQIERRQRGSVPVVGAKR